ncbi:hypothetical protein C4K04_5429 [Pseudomonas chlororaphis]|uniref:Uncharacterized protein n=1 Tax=Pseudomonas chlororaphis TaxID=587753 RepID=A0A3G7TVD4_9PSED|nr:hypothetical protein [Pseudomonas chlororaphis]AZE51077.1 hypothetical protein C4K04_5429 [Pseudomonas chlororaphis]
MLWNVYYVSAEPEDQSDFRDYTVRAIAPILAASRKRSDVIKHKSIGLRTYPAEIVRISSEPI